MDLLQAVIVGAPGTPYHDGLFFFDIFLPPEYPHEPPVSLGAYYYYYYHRLFIQCHYITHYGVLSC